MGFGIEARAGVNRPALGEYGPNGIKVVVIIIGRDNAVKVFDDGAVQLPQNLVLVRWHRAFRRAGDGSEALIRGLNHANPGRCHEVETVAKVNHCPNYRRISNRLYAKRLHLRDEVQTSLRIGFPEVDTASQPIIRILTWLEWRAAKKFFSYAFVTTMIA